MALELEKVTDSVKEVIEKVENPSDLEAKATFGYKPTEKEQRQKALLKDLFEKAWWVLALLVVFVILVWNWQHIRAFFDFLTGPAEPPPVLETPPPVASQVVSSIFAGRAQQLTEDKGWLRPELLTNVVYYSAGEITSGQYAGGERFFATAQLATGEIRMYDLWELPDGQVLLNGGKPNPKLWRQNLQDFYLGQFFADEVSIRDEMTDDFPQVLPLNTTMLLYRREVLTDLGPYDGAVMGTGRLLLTLDPKEYQSLEALEARNYKDLKLYSKTYNGEELFSQLTEAMPAELDSTADQFLLAGTKIVVTDPTGVGMVYELVFNDQWDNYVRVSLNRDLLNLEFYQQELIKYSATAAFGEYKAGLLAGEMQAYPAGLPGAPMIEEGRPGLLFNAMAFDFDEVRPLFTDFGDAFMATCEAVADAKVVQNLSESELEEIGAISIPQVPIYRLRDNEHPLNNMAHNLKFVHQNLGEEVFIEENMDWLMQLKEYDRRQQQQISSGRLQPAMPNTAEYAAKLPLLFIYDPWGRPVVIWETNVKFLQQCDIISGS